MQQAPVAIAHINEGSPAKHALHLHILQDVAYTDWDGLGVALAHLARCAWSNITLVELLNTDETDWEVDKPNGQPVGHQRLLC